MALRPGPVRDASWLHPHRSTMRTQGARPGLIPIMGMRNGQTWSKSDPRTDGRFGYAGYGRMRPGRMRPGMTMQRTSAKARGGVLQQSNEPAFSGYGLVQRYGLEVWTEPSNYVSPYKTPTRSVYRGYSGVGVSPDVFKKPTNWGAIGVGGAVFASTIAASMLVQGLVNKGATPSWKGAVPTILPAMGAGFIAYLLRWKLDKLCNCPESVPSIMPFEPDVAGEMVAMTGRERPEVRAIPQCPEGSEYNPETGICEYGLI